MLCHTQKVIISSKLCKACKDLQICNKACKAVKQTMGHHRHCMFCHVDIGDVNIGKETRIGSICKKCLHI